MNNYIVLETDIMCFILTVYVFFKTLFSPHPTLSSKRFLRLTGFAVLFILSDMLYMLFANVPFSYNVTVAYIINVCYYVLLTLIGAYWFCMADAYVSRITEKPLISSVLKWAPFTVVVLFALLTPQFRLLFRIDENMKFVRGPFNCICFIVPFLYLLWSCILLLKTPTKGYGYDFRMKKFNMLLFPIPAAVFSLIQPFIPTLSFTPVGYTLSLLLYFTEYRNSISNTDPLTEIYNRIYIMKTLDAMLKLRKGSCVMIDIDNFKSVNDEYGHITGDMLLLDFVKRLKATADEYNFIPARYAGDEFMVLCRTENDEKIKGFIRDFELSLKDLVIPGTNISVTASMGYAKTARGISTASAFVDAADEQMYLIKSQKRIHIPKATDK